MAAPPSIPSTNQVADLIASGKSCAPNISAAGRRRRRRFAGICIIAGVAALVVSVATGAPWYCRVFLAIPGALAAIGLLQARRGTCVARAAEGTFEHDDFSKTKVSAAQAARSRRAAAVITRDTVLIGILCGGLAAATALLH